tara:strand:- start:1454 stop:1909 length:456 start_codon:yes stop_codon:yes gene_type:complete
MAYQPKTNGPNFVPAYQISGTPFVTSSTGVTTTAQQISFPQATRFFQITNTGDTHLRIGFSENGVNGNPSTHNHYFVLSGGVSTERLELRCKDLFIRSDTVENGSFSLIAGLSGVARQQFPVLTGTFILSGANDEPLHPLGTGVPKFEGIG